MLPEPATYFLTWRTYGTWLPGDERGWVDERRNGRGEPMQSADPRLENAARGQMRFAAVTFDEEHRRVADDVIREACAFRGWTLSAINVRSNHVHFLVRAAEAPEEVQRMLKARVSRRFRELGWFATGSPLWARSGSQRRLSNDEAVSAAVDYVRNRQ